MSWCEEREISAMPNNKMLDSDKDKSRLVLSGASMKTIYNTLTYTQMHYLSHRYNINMHTHTRTHNSLFPNLSSRTRRTQGTWRAVGTRRIAMNGVILNMLMNS